MRLIPLPRGRQQSPDLAEQTRTGHGRTGIEQLARSHLCLSCNGKADKKADQAHLKHFEHDHAPGCANSSYLELARAKTRGTRHLIDRRGICI